MAAGDGEDHDMGEPWPKTSSSDADSVTTKRLVGEPKLPHEASGLRREIEHRLRLCRCVLELLASDQRQRGDDADRRDDRRRRRTPR